MIAKFDGATYRIDSSYDIDLLAKEMLTDSESAFQIPLYIWLEIAENVHLESEFIVNITSKLSGKDEFEKLYLALKISDRSSAAAIVFWNCIYSMDDIDLYSKSIVAAANTYVLEDIVHELSTELVANGHSLLNQLVEGMFDIVDLYENDESDHGIFYIYSVDSGSWDV